MLFKIFMFVLLYTNVSEGALDIDGLSKECYTQPGDILFGALIPVRKPGCGKLRPRSMTDYHAFKYGLQKAQDDPSILPNITIGFVILDSCTSDRGMVGQSLFFIPDDDSPKPSDVQSCIATKSGNIMLQDNH